MNKEKGYFIGIHAKDYTTLDLYTGREKKGEFIEKL